MTKLVSIDARFLDAAGIGTYITQLAPRIIELNRDLSFSLVGDPDRLAALPWGDQENVRIEPFQAGMYSLREQLRLPVHLADGSSLLWVPHVSVPVSYAGPLVTTVHDTFHLTMPELLGGLHKRAYARFMYGVVRRKSDVVLTVSEFSKRELIGRAHVPPERIRVTPLGVDGHWFKPPPGASPDASSYFVFVGSVKPHKNLSGLLRAFELAQARIPHKLVIIGRREGLLTADRNLEATANRLGDRLQFTGYIDDALLKRYIAHAEALVLPSLYEGFGLPPLEAMASGCPVLVSRTASLPEVCGNAALYCDPARPEDIAEKIVTLLSDRSLRETLRRRGLEHARSFSWDRCAEQTSAALRECLESSEPAGLA